MDFVTGIYNALKTNATGMVAITTIVIFVFQAIFNPMEAFLERVLLLLAVAFPTLEGVALSSFAFVDYFVPLSELAGLCAIWLPVFLLVTVIRIFKSLIPFIS